MKGQPQEVPRPDILIEGVEQFLAMNQFDFYIGNPFSAHFLPEGANSLILTRSNYSDLPRLLQKVPKEVRRILAFGAGSVFDPAKYMAKETNSDLTIIPSALSVNSFATHRSSFFDGQSKRSFETKPPTTIVLDYELLKGAGVLNSVGIVEVAATATAQADWLGAIKKGLEFENRDIEERCASITENAIGMLGAANHTSVNLEQLFENLLESGLMTQAFGNGRPVSGSEHIISAYIENSVPCAHGAGLYIGIQIAAELQQKINDFKTKKALVIAELLANSNEIKTYVRAQLSEGDVRESLKNLKPRGGRYSVLDTVSRPEINDAIDSTCAKIYSIAT